MSDKPKEENPSAELLKELPVFFIEELPDEDGDILEVVKKQSETRSAPVSEVAPASDILPEQTIAPVNIFQVAEESKLPENEAVQPRQGLLIQLSSAAAEALPQAPIGEAIVEEHHVQPPAQDLVSRYPGLVAQRAAIERHVVQPLPLSDSDEEDEVEASQTHESPQNPPFPVEGFGVSLWNFGATMVDATKGLLSTIGDAFVLEESDSDFE